MSIHSIGLGCTSAYWLTKSIPPSNPRGPNTRRTTRAIELAYANGRGDETQRTPTSSERRAKKAPCDRRRDAAATTMRPSLTFELPPPHSHPLQAKQGSSSRRRLEQGAAAAAAIRSRRIDTIIVLVSRCRTSTRWTTPATTRPRCRCWRGCRPRRGRPGRST